MVIAVAVDAQGDRDEGVTASVTLPPDPELVAALRCGDEAAFVALFTTYHAAMLRLAMVYVGRRTVAEEVVQETWIGVLQGIGRFEGRSSLKTWIFSILVNRAKTRAVREGRNILFADLWTPGDEAAEAAVEPERFRDEHDQWPHHWATPPRSWDNHPEERLLAQEVREHILQVIATLPPSQQEVITLRDIEGWSAEEVCNVLNISETNQRVLLHRARSRVRRALERYLDEI